MQSLASVYNIVIKGIILSEFLISSIGVCQRFKNFRAMWLFKNLPLLTFMATLLSKYKVSWTQIFEIKILLSCLKLSKMYSPSAFFKDRLKLYVFESPKIKWKFDLRKKVLKCLKFGLSWVKNGRILHMFLDILEFTVEHK